MLTVAADCLTAVRHVHRMLTAVLLLAMIAGTAQPPATSPATPRVVPNDNRAASGTRNGDTLTLRLVARLAEWHPDGDSLPGIVVETFAEAGGPPRVPGPLVRVRHGTVVAAEVRNTLGDTLRLFGLHARPVAGVLDTTPLVIAPGAVGAARFALDAPGTYLYWGSTTRRPISFRTGVDAQLSGAIVVDSARARGDDRVFVISGMSDTVHRAGLRRTRILVAINGRSWPNTERLDATVGDAVRWRVINASADVHPMHLHGFYFRVTSRGDGVRDTIYAPRGGRPPGDLAVTEPVFSATAVSITWVPERAGNWLFHCHIPEHFGARGPLGMPPPAGAAHDHALDHARGGMSGLVLGVTVRQRPGEPRPGEPHPGAIAARTPRAGAERRLRLLVRENVGSTDSVPLYGYAIHERGAEPPPDTGLVGAPTLDLVRGEPVRITIVNRLLEPTAVHWHGIELDAYYDGVPGFSGAGGRVTPLVAPNDSFEVRFTPPRRGTFIYHTHADELRQQYAGLVGAIVVREPGPRRDPGTDIPVVITSPIGVALDRRVALINGRTSPSPLTMTVGTAYRLRLIQMSVPRAAATVDVLRGDADVAWRPVAKDGADLPPWARAPQTARAFLTVGETYDYVVTPDAPGELRLEVRLGQPKGVAPTAPGAVVRGAVWTFRVVAPDSATRPARPGPPAPAPARSLRDTPRGTP